MQPPWFVKSSRAKLLLLSKDFTFDFKFQVGPVLSLCLLKGQAHLGVNATISAKLVEEKKIQCVLPD